MPDLDAHRVSALPHVPLLMQRWLPTHGDERHVQVDGLASEDPELDRLEAISSPVLTTGPDTTAVR